MPALRRGTCCSARAWAPASTGSSAPTLAVGEPYAVGPQRNRNARQFRHPRRALRKMPARTSKSPMQSFGASCGRRTNGSSWMASKKAKLIKAKFAPSVCWPPACQRDARKKARGWSRTMRTAPPAQGKEPTDNLFHQARSLRHRRTRGPEKRKYRAATYPSYSKSNEPLGGTERPATRVRPLAFPLQSVHGHAYAANTKTAG